MEIVESQSQINDGEATTIAALSSSSSSSSENNGNGNGTDVVLLVDKFVEAATRDPVRIRRLVASLEDRQQRLLGSVVTSSPSASLIVGSGDSWLQDENSQQSTFISSSTTLNNLHHQQPQQQPNISASLASVASSTGGSSANEGSSVAASETAANSKTTTASSNFFATAKMSRLEAERNDLLMQVSVLSAQVSAQQEKISELEAINTTPTAITTNGNSLKKLTNGNGTVITSPLSSENGGGGNDSRNGTLSNGSTQHRLDLLSEISTLKVRLATAENTARDWEAKYAALQKITTQQIKERDMQLADLRNRLVRQQQQQVPPDAVYEIDRLRRAVDSLLTSNVDKERKIDELQAGLLRYRRMFDSAVEDAAFSDTASAKSLNIGRYMGPNGQPQQGPLIQQMQPQQIVAPIYSRPSIGSAYAPIGGDSISLTGDGYSATYPYPRTSSRVEQYTAINGGGGTISRPPSVLRQNGPIPPMQDQMPTQVVTPLVMHQQNMNSSALHAEDDSAGELNDVVYDDVVGHHHHHHPLMGQQQLHQRNGPITRSLRVPRPGDEGQMFWGQQQQQQMHRQPPVPHFSTSNVSDTVFDENLPSVRPKKSASTGRPSPHPTSMSGDDEQRRVEEAAAEYKHRLNHSSNEATSSSNSVARSASKFASGLGRFLGLTSKKTAATAAKTVDAEEIGAFGSLEGNGFVRGGVRATVATTGTVPRRYVAPTFPAGGSSFQNLTTVPPRMWDSEQVARWLADLGLQQYVVECRRNIHTGDRLLQLSGPDFEKELGMKNTLHVKKLQIAIGRLRAIASGNPDVDHPSSRLHSALVLRWLDDVGLPQLKDVFVECQIDGAVLNMLSLEDLAQLRITSRLHALSIRWGITALRAANFDLNRFIRRPPLPDGSDRVGNFATNNDSANNNDGEKEENRVEEPPSRVLFWTCHRVMDWLRSVDLAEYAANVRGSGLHGAVMLLESTFTAETLAAILQIPTNRSLLRRHLAQKFDQLVGQAAAEVKSATGQSEVLLPTTKLKLKKSSNKPSIFGSSSNKHQQHQISAAPPLTVDVFAGSSNSSLNASLLSSPSVDGKILANIVGTSSGTSSKRNSPPIGNGNNSVVITPDASSGSGGTTSGADSMASSMTATVPPSSSQQDEITPANTTNNTENGTTIVAF